MIDLSAFYFWQENSRKSNCYNILTILKYDKIRIEVISISNTTICVFEFLE